MGDRMSTINVNNVSPETGTKVSLGGTSVGIPTASSAPSSPSAGDQYWNTTTNKLYVYSGTGWIVSATSFQASGGSVTTSGIYTVHTFTSSGSFVVTSGTSDVEYIVVAGGGGGGMHQSGVVVQVDIDHLSSGKTLEEATAQNQCFPYQQALIP